MPWPVSWLTGRTSAARLPNRLAAASGCPLRDVGDELPDHSGEGRSGFEPLGAVTGFPNTTARSP